MLLLVLLFNIGEFCKLKITPIVVFVIMTQRIFPSWALALTHRTISILLCSLIDEVGFSCNQRAIVFI